LIEEDFLMQVSSGLSMHHSFSA